jgi:hypothetical protein
LTRGRHSPAERDQLSAVGLPEDITLSEGRSSPRSVRYSSRRDKLENQASQTSPSYRTRRIPHSTSRISPQIKSKQDEVQQDQADYMSVLVACNVVMDLAVGVPVDGLQKLARRGRGRFINSTYVHTLRFCHRRSEQSTNRCSAPYPDEVFFNSRRGPSPHI